MKLLFNLFMSLILFGTLLFVTLPEPNDPEPNYTPAYVLIGSLIIGFIVLFLIKKLFKRIFTKKSDPSVLPISVPDLLELLRSIKNLPCPIVLFEKEDYFILTYDSSSEEFKELYNYFNFKEYYSLVIKIDEKNETIYFQDKVTSSPISNSNEINFSSFHGYKESINMAISDGNKRTINLSALRKTAMDICYKNGWSVNFNFLEPLTSTFS